MDNKCQNWRKLASLDISDLAKIEKRLPTSFWENGLKCKKGTILTFWPLKMTIRAIQTSPSYGMLLMPSQRSFMPKTVTEAFLRLTPPSLSPDGRTDRQMYNSVLEKLRCLSAGGTKTLSHRKCSLFLLCTVLKWISYILSYWHHSFDGWGDRQTPRQIIMKIDGRPLTITCFLSYLV